MEMTMHYEVKKGEDVLRDSLASNSSGGESLAGLLAKQRQDFDNNPYSSIEERTVLLNKLRSALRSYQEQLIESINSDFGGRSRNETLLAEVMPIMESIKYNLKHLKKWMRADSRHVSIKLQPASARVIYQPLGVVGIIVPWNYPLFLAVSPIVTALAAGNRVMVKMSEFTPKTSALFAQIIKEAFLEEQVTVVNGGADIAVAFSRLPFDHLLFTGSTAVGKQVMAAAAQNLTPVTLELGGKSPVIVGRDFPLRESARRICFGKSVNTGQTCIAPDYVLIHQADQNEFVQEYIDAFKKMYPTLNNNDDYSAVINERQFKRLQLLLEDAKAKGADIRPVSSEVINDHSRRMVPQLVLNPTVEMLVMQEEIFGPILPIFTVKSLDEAISYVQKNPRPLALYYFGFNQETQQKILSTTHSGGVCINDTLLQVAVDDLPFGGIGPSGMGHYHSREGFLTFSKAKPVLTKGGINSAKWIYPPYKGFLKKLIVRFLTGSK